LGICKLELKYMQTKATKRWFAQHKLCVTLILH